MKSYHGGSMLLDKIARLKLKWGGNMDDDLSCKVDGYLPSPPAAVVSVAVGPVSVSPASPPPAVPVSVPVSLGVGLGLGLRLSLGVSLPQVAVASPVVVWAVGVSPPVPVGAGVSPIPVAVVAVPPWLDFGVSPGLSLRVPLPQVAV